MFSHSRAYFSLSYRFQKGHQVQLSFLTIPIAHDVLESLWSGCIQPYSTQALLSRWNLYPNTRLLDTHLPNESLPQAKDPWPISRQVHECLSLVLCHASHLA